MPVSAITHLREKFMSPKGMNNKSTRIFSAGTNNNKPTEEDVTI